MKVYIAGPMRGYPNFNFAEFDRVRDVLTQQGHTVISPADLDRAYGIDVSNLTADDMTVEFNKEVIRRDLCAIMDADGIVMLEGWENSVGATVERQVAQWVGLPVYYVRDLASKSQD